jgi:hypothetical protein
MIWFQLAKKETQRIAVLSALIPRSIDRELSFTKKRKRKYQYVCLFWHIINGRRLDDFVFTII